MGIVLETQCLVNLQAWDLQISCRQILHSQICMQLNLGQGELNYMVSIPKG